MFSARNRQNPFAARRKRAAEAEAEAAAAVQPQPAPEPTPAHPNPAPEPQATPYVHENEVPTDEVTDTPDVSTLAAEPEPVQQFEPIPEDEQPLGDLREVAELAERASTRIENGDMAVEIPLPPGAVQAIAEELQKELREATPEQATKRGRGRPRPQETIERDAAVLNLLKENMNGISKADIAVELNEKEQQVYSSLRQLSKEGHVRTAYSKNAQGYLWFVV